MKKEKLLMGEIIGKKVKIIKSTQKEQTNKTGTVIDETMKTITLETKGKTTIIPKKETTFEIEGIKIEGKEIQFRPEERIKKYWRKFNAKMR